MVSEKTWKMRVSPFRTGLNSFVLVRQETAVCCTAREFSSAPFLYSSAFADSSLNSFKNDGPYADAVFTAVFKVVPSAESFRITSSSRCESV